MKRLILPLFVIACVVASCTKAEPDVTAAAGIETIHDDGISEAVSNDTMNAGEVSAAYQRISGDEAAGMMNGDVILLDVRTAEEYDEGHIQDAILIPYDEMADKAADNLPDKDAVILVYCRTGRRSEIAAKELVSMGYTAVYDFGGITTDWNGEVVK